MVDADYNILSRARILLVEADESIRDDMMDYFRNITRLFTVVKSAEEALPLLEGPLWDIVVCNLNLPGINGLEFSTLASQQKPGTKIILATQYPNPALKNKMTDYGIVETISAPLTPESLIASLIYVYSSVKAETVKNPKKAETSFDVPETVSIQELDDSMIITAFVRFGKKYKAINELTCTWIQHNFKGVRAHVNRKGRDLEVMIGQIEPGDDIKKLHQFPITLMNLTFVRKQLIKELKERGFLAFEVKRKPTEQSLKQQIRLGAINRAQEFIGKVSEGIAFREWAGDTVKELMSGDGEDEINTYDLVNQVENIVKSGTAQAISVIAALKKSDQTYTHCVDVGAIFLTVYLHWIKAEGLTNQFENEAEILLSAILHDIGKIFLPKEILESSARFDIDGPEMQMMREHPIDSAKILADLNMSSLAINMAKYHHVRVDTSLLSSYPVIERYSQVAIETRLLSIVDMFQALVRGRSYKKSWYPSAALKFIDRLVGIECDIRAWNAFRGALGWYPIGSLVKLNDGSQAFVVERSSERMNRPAVAVTRNSFDEDLTHNTYIDLSVEKDTFITRGLNHFEIYGNQAINRFAQMQVS